jgi:chromosome segregation ATPase
MGATPPTQGRAGDVGQANPCDAENKITGASVKLAQSITDCLDHFLLEANRQATINRDQLQIAQSALTSVAEKVQELDDRLVALSGSSEVTDRNYHDLANRLFSVEQHQHPETSDPGIERRIGESFKAVSEQVRTQGTIIWSLEQMVHEQAQKIDTRVASFVSQVTKELENIARTLAMHAELVGRLSETQVAIEAAQKSLDQRLNQQAKAIESVQGGAEAQGEAWGQVAALALQLAHSFTKTDQELGVPERLQAAQRRRVSETLSTMGEPADGKHSGCASGR